MADRQDGARRSRNVGAQSQPTYYRDRSAGQDVIVGLGTDLTEIERIEKSIARFGHRFLERIFTPAEIEYCLRKKKSSAESFAARFAAKEAAAKALGTGISRGVSWQEVEVTRQASGKPGMRLHGKAEERAARMGVLWISVSLTHTRGLAMAIVLMEGSDSSRI